MADHVSSFSGDIRKAIFPAAGFGTRFLPATKATPKEMLPIVDKPLIQYAIEEAKEAGIGEIIIVTGMGKTAIEDHFDTSFELEYFLKQKGKEDVLKMIRDISNLIHVTYTRQKEPKGLGDAILCTKNLIGDEPFAVLLSDDIIDSEVPAIGQMMDTYNRYDGSVLAIQKVPEDQTHAYGIIDAEEVDDGVYKVLDMVEKPRSNPPSNLAIIGRYILTPGVFECLETTRPGAGGEVQLTDAIKELSANEEVYACEFEGDRYDAGDKLGFLMANVSLALKRDDIREGFKGFLRNLLDTV